MNRAPPLHNWARSNKVFRCTQVKALTLLLPLFKADNWTNCIASQIFHYIYAPQEKWASWCTYNLSFTHFKFACQSKHLHNLGLIVFTHPKIHQEAISHWDRIYSYIIYILLLPVTGKIASFSIHVRHL